VRGYLPAIRKSLLVPAIASIGMLAGCGRTTARPPSSALDEAAREYVRLAVALGDRDPDALDFYYGPQDWVADIHRHPPSLAEIKKAAQEIAGKLTELPVLKDADARRGSFLLGQLKAISARADLLLAVSHTFDQEAELFFGIHLTSGTPDLAAVRSELARLLPRGGDLAARYAAFDERFMIPPERVPLVMERAVQACREQTLAHWKLPADEKVTLEYVHDKPWSAYSSYQGGYHSIIRINLDLGLTVDRALRLACHEGYPGHHVFNALTEEQLVRTQNRREFWVQPTFSPQSLLSEAAATVAPDLAFSGPERVRFEQNVLFPLAKLRPTGTQQYLIVERLVDALNPTELAVARDYLDGKLEFVRAAAALNDQALMAHAEATLRYLNEYRTYVVTYTEGKDRLEKWLDLHASESEASDGRWGTFQRLIGEAGFGAINGSP
jgi:hypothetical protein